MNTKKLIVLDGQEACGKSSLCSPLVEKVRLAGLKAETFREPGGTTVGEDMRKLLLSHTEVESMSLFYGFQIARVELLAHMLRMKGTDVFVLDRFWPSTWAYQVCGAGISKVIFEAAQIAIARYLEQFSAIKLFYLECPDSIRLERMKKSGKGGDRYESKNAAYHQCVREGYEYLVEQGHMIRIDASKSPEEVLEAVYKQI